MIFLPDRQLFLYVIVVNQYVNLDDFPIMDVVLNLNQNQNHQEHFPKYYINCMEDHYVCHNKI